MTVTPVDGADAHVGQDVPVTGGAAAERIPFVWHPRTRRHAPAREYQMGLPRPSRDVTERVNVIREALIAAGHAEITARDPDPEALCAVHSQGMIDHLRTIHDAWTVAGYATDPGQDRVVPWLFPTPAMLGGTESRRPTATHARAGHYCYDTITLLGPGTWDAVEAAAGAALTAVDLVADAAWVRDRPADGSDADPLFYEGAPRHPGVPRPPLGTPAPAAYALTRPAGHHAAAAAFGGTCYLNNAAIAAAALRRRGARRVALLDIDAHHGNGNQAIFYDRSDVFVGSVHVDPAAGHFPHFLGFADETGRGAGAGSNLNLPLPSKSGDDRWIPAVEQLVAQTRSSGADALVVSMGVDFVADDPVGPLRVSREGLMATGVLLGSLGLPTVLVQEGGRHLPILGSLVTAMLAAVAEGAVRAAAVRG
jgi:acetoin utilization deacetylase AcuC-like enzyme